MLCEMWILWTHVHGYCKYCWSAGLRVHNRIQIGGLCPPASLHEVVITGMKPNSIVSCMHVHDVMVHDCTTQRVSLRHLHCNCHSTYVSYLFVLTGETYLGEVMIELLLANTFNSSAGPASKSAADTSQAGHSAST